MARSMGDWTTGHSNEFRCGFDWHIDGTTIVIDDYIGDSEFNINDEVTVTKTGKVTGSYSYDWNSSGGAVNMGSGGSFTGSRGTAYTFGVKVTGIYNGAEPTHSASITIPAVEPGKVSKPSISSITDDSFVVTWSAPATNGASIDEYEVQRYTISSGFTSTESSGDRSHTFTGLASNTQYKARVRAHNSAGWGTWSDYSSTITTKPDPPSAPSTPVATRTSDTSHKVTWNRVASTSKPYTSQAVQRRANSGSSDASWGSWTTIYTVSTDYTTSGSHTYTDTSTKANYAYNYRITATNSAGTATSGSTPNVYTTPAAPTGQKATKTATGNILVSWVPGSTFSGIDYLVQHSTDGGTTWATLVTATGTSYTHTAPTTNQTHTYRVRTQIDAAGAVGDNLASAYVVTNTVQLAAPPAAPTITGPSGVQDATLDITLTWLHNSIDSSEQTKFQWQWRYAGDTTWITSAEIVSTEQSLLVPADTWENGRTVEWAVKTWGVHATGSPFSATASFPTSSPPQVSITQPADGVVWVVPTVTVAWEFFDAEGETQAAWQMELVDEAERVVETRSGEGTATTDTFTQTVSDGSTWIVRLRVRDGAGMWSEWVSTAFSVDYPEPPKPLISAVWNPVDGSIEVSVVNPATDESLRDPVEAAIETWRPGSEVVWSQEEPSDTSAIWVDPATGDAYQNTDPGVPGTVDYAWTGTANASTSTETVDGVLARTNHATRPVPTGTYGTAGSGGYISTAVASWPTVITAGAGRNGRDAATVTRTVTTPSTIVGRWNYIGQALNGATNGLPVPPGSVTVSAYMKCSVPGWRAHLQVSWYDDANVLIGSADAQSQVTATPDAQGWYRATYTPVRPAGATKVVLAQVSMPTGSTVGGETCAVTDAQIEIGSVATPWFYGGLADDAGPAWVAVTDPGVVAAGNAYETALGNVPVAVSNDIYRSIDGGPYELVATDIGTNSGWADRTAPVAGEICYLAVAWSDLPSANQSDPYCLTIYDGTTPCLPADANTAMSVWISGGAGFEQVCRAYLDLAISEDVGLAERVLQRFSGRTYPVEFSGVALSQVVKVSFTTGRHQVVCDGQQIASLNDWREISRLPGPHLYRDFEGRAFYCSLGPLNAVRQSDGGYACSLAVTQVSDPQGVLTGREWIIESTPESLVALP